MPSFTAAGIPGAHLVWRECMAEGPVIAGFDDDFWKKRETYLGGALEGFGILPGSITDWQKQTCSTLIDQQWDEVTLWFEYDLHCQFNAMAALNWLLDQGKVKTISMARLVDAKGEPCLQTQLESKGLKSIYKARISLNEEDLGFAANFWSAFSSENPEGLFQLLDEIPGNFPDLGDALHSHFFRFPSLYNGLDRVEEILLRFIEDQQPTSMKELVNGFQEIGHIFGFGDWQVVRYLRKLSPQLVTFNGKQLEAMTTSGQLQFEGEIALTELADDMLWHRKNWLNFHDFHEYRGGVLLAKSHSMYFWDPLEFGFV